MDVTTTEPRIDLTDPRSFAGSQPHEAFRWMREHEPVYRHPRPDGGHFWVLTRHADVRAVGRDHRRFSNEAGGIHYTDLPSEALEVTRNMMLFMDPPEHHRYRRLVRDQFQPDGAIAVRPRIEALARQIVDAVEGRDTFDLVTDVAGELPSFVIADLLGIALDDGRKLYDLTEKMHSTSIPPEQSGAATFEMLHYAANVRNSKLGSPSDDLSSALVHATVNGEQLSAEQFCWFFLLLINAGGDTTRNAVGGGMLTLFEHPDQMRKLQADLDTLLPTAVDEILRWVSPVIYMRRTALTDVELDGVTIPEGEAVALYYGAANRDPAAFDDPETFDVGRVPNDHIAFGGGPHFCLGVHLARIEIEVMLREMLTRLPDLHLAGEPEWQDSTFIWGPKHLPVRTR